MVYLTGPTYLKAAAEAWLKILYVKLLHYIFLKGGGILKLCRNLNFKPARFKKGEPWRALKKIQAVFFTKLFFFVQFSALMNTYHNCIVYYLNYTGSNDQVH